MATAGPPIAYSGITVAIGLLSLIVLPVPALRSIGIGGMLVPARQRRRHPHPAARRCWPPPASASTGPAASAGRHASRAWTRLGAADRAAPVGSRRSRRWRCSRALGAAATGIKIGEPAASALGTTAPAAQTLRTLRARRRAAGRARPRSRYSPRRHCSRPARRGSWPRCPACAPPPRPAGPAWRHDGTALVSVSPPPSHPPPRARATLAASGAATRAPGALVGGPGALLLDENHVFYGRFPLLHRRCSPRITIIVLARAFRSLLLPVKAVLLNLASVAPPTG